MYQPEPEGNWQYFRLPFYPKNILVVHTAGEFAKNLDKMSDKDVFSLFKQRFTKAYPGSEFLENAAITNWSNNQFAKGAYSYTRPLGSDTQSKEALNARKQMAKPIDRLIYFAGEAYNTAAYGTLHGAYIDGQYAAENMLRETA